MKTLTKILCLTGLLAVAGCGKYITAPNENGEKQEWSNPNNPKPGDKIPEAERAGAMYSLDTPDVFYSDDVKSRLDKVREMYWDLIITPKINIGCNILLGFDVAPRVYGAGNSYMDEWIKYIATGEEPDIPYIESNLEKFYEHADALHVPIEYFNPSNN